MTKIRIIIPLLLLLVASFSAEARFHRAVLRDSLLNELRHVSNPHDSLDIYLDILDLAVNKDRSGSIREIYRLAQRTHNITVQLEMLQRMANLYASSENPDSLSSIAASSLPMLFRRATCSVQRSCSSI